jgi:prophage regulatory protein
MRLMRLPAVMAQVGLSRSSIYAAVSRDEFPRQVSLGARSVAWRESDVEEWIRRREVKTSGHHNITGGNVVGEAR